MGSRSTTHPGGVTPGVSHIGLPSLPSPGGGGLEAPLVVALQGSIQASQSHDEEKHPSFLFQPLTYDI